VLKLAGEGWTLRSIARHPWVGLCRETVARIVNGGYDLEPPDQSDDACEDDRPLGLCFCCGHKGFLVEGICIACWACWERSLNEKDFRGLEEGPIVLGLEFTDAAMEARYWEARASAERRQHGLPGLFEPPEPEG
jgi:hypothetical protein